MTLYLDNYPRPKSHCKTRISYLSQHWYVNRRCDRANDTRNPPVIWSSSLIWGYSDEQRIAKWWKKKTRSRARGVAMNTRAISPENVLVRLLRKRIKQIVIQETWMRKKLHKQNALWDFFPQWFNKTNLSEKESHISAKSCTFSKVIYSFHCCHKRTLEITVETQ